VKFCIFLYKFAEVLKQAENKGQESQEQKEENPKSYPSSSDGLRRDANANPKQIRMTKILNSKQNTVESI